MSPGVTAEDGGATLLGKQVSDLQSGVAIGNGAITGTLYKNEGWSSGYLKGPGYYLALKFTSSNWSQYDSVKVGLDPSAQSGIIEILNDPDKNGVFKVKQNLSQKFVVEYRKGDAVERDVYDLSGLTLSEEPPTPPTPTGEKIFDVKDETGTLTYLYSNNMAMPNVVEVTQTISEFEDDTELAEGDYTGTISGGLISGTSGGNKVLCFNFRDDFVTWLKENGPADINIDSPLFKITYSEKDANNQEVASGSIPKSTLLQGTTNDVPIGIPIAEGAAELSIELTAKFIDSSLQPIADSDKVFTFTYMVGGLIT